MTKVRIVVIICLVALMISALVDYSVVTYEKINNDYREHLEETGHQLAEGVYQHMQASLSYVKGMAEVFGEYEDIHEEEALAMLKKANKHSDFKRMWLTKANGQAMSSEGVESDATGRPYLEAGLRGESGVSEVQYSRVHGERNVTVYAPIYHEKKIVGLCIGIYALEELGDIINIDCFEGKGYSHIVRTNGEIVTLSEHESVEDEVEEKGIIRSWDKYEYTCPIGINDWNIFVTFPKEMIDHDMKTAAWSAGGLCMKFLFVICILFIMLYQMKKQMFRSMAQIDSMTGLTNRGTIESLINASLKQTKDKNSALMIFDVDHFKLVNDTMGHMAGDLLLKKIANIIREDFSEIDYLGRLGGDEFAVFMRDVQQIDMIKEKGERLIDRIAHIATELNWDVETTISVGVALSNRDGNTFEGLYRVADAYLYQVKEKGGNGISGLEND